MGPCLSARNKVAVEDYLPDASPQDDTELANIKGAEPLAGIQVINRAKSVKEAQVNEGVRLRVMMGEDLEVLLIIKDITTVSTDAIVCASNERLM